MRAFWKMLQIYAHSFVRLLDELRELQASALRGWPSYEAAKPTMEKIGFALLKILKDSNELELSSTLKQARNIVVRMNEPNGIPFVELAPMFEELRRRFTEDLEDRAFFCIPSRKVLQFFEKASDGEFRGELVLKTAAALFGDSFTQAFPSAILDIEEASRCLISNRNTASVFHLMRLMEVCLHALGKSLNAPVPIHNPNWESILRKCDTELAKRRDQRCAEWQSDDQFFSEATANLRAVKDAWRNPTMHIEIHYDEERALEVWRSVRAFAQHLATRLHE